MLGFRSDLIKLLVSRGDQVYAFALDYDDRSRVQVKELGAIPIDYVFSRSGLNPFSDMLNTWNLSRVLKEIAPDVVFSYFSKPVIFGTFAAVLAGCKRRIGMLEGLGYPFTNGPNGANTKALLLRRIQVLLYRISFPYLERLIFLNPDDPVDLVESYKIRVARVSILGGIGLNFEHYRYSKPRLSPVTFIFVGRLLAEKGIHQYVAAAKIVRKFHQDVVFIVLGGLDPENPGALTSDDLNALVKEGIIVYPGYVNNVQDWIADSSVFVLPSYYREGVPRSTQEAMAIGRPIITTNVPGCRETVIDGINGWLIPAFIPEILAEKMCWFIENVHQIEAMGLESLRLARERFDERVVNKILADYFDDAKEA